MATESMIELSDIPAIIKWDDVQPAGVGSSLSSTPVSLDIDFDPSSTTTTASFRLRVALLKRHSDKTVPVFLIIGAPQILSLATDVPDQTADDAAGATVRLHFELSSPPTLVVPAEPLRLSDNTQHTTMQSVRLAARQTVLTVHIPSHALSVQQLRPLCEASYDQSKSNPLTDVARLYGGRGGKIVEVGADDAPSESGPPSYNDMSAPPPMAPLDYGSDNASSSKKRRRVESPNEDCDVTLIEILCKKIANEQYERTRAELSNMETRLVRHLEQGMDERVHDLKKTCDLRFQKLEGQMQELRTEFEAKTQELTTETQGLDDYCQAEKERVNDWFHQVSDDIDQRIDLEVEDRMLGIKADLEDFVKDELSSTADTLKQRIAEASMFIEFRE